MKKRTFSALIAAFTFAAFLTGANPCKSIPSVVKAADLNTNQITVNSEYTIPDKLDWCTYYVVVATNNTGKDISVSADFTALDRNGRELAKVNDYSEAVRKGQQFIMYGQFRNTKITNADNFKYSFKVEETDNCTYTSVDVDAVDVGECVQISATNYSGKDIQGVGVRTVFLRKGKPVAFDVVNIADVGYTFHGGSTNSQIIGYNADKYDDYILTYTSAGGNEMSEF